MTATLVCPFPAVITATVALATWQSATCHTCGSDLGQVQSLASGWVDLDQVDVEIAELFKNYLMSDEARPACGT